MNNEILILFNNLNATSMFNHGNIRIPVFIDRVLRLFVVTPDMHRVHHFMGHEKMRIGLDKFKAPKMLRLHWLLAMPFLKAR